MEDTTVVEQITAFVDYERKECSPVKILPKLLVQLQRVDYYARERENEGSPGRPRKSTFYMKIQCSI